MKINNLNADKTPDFMKNKTLVFYYQRKDLNNDLVHYHNCYNDRILESVKTGKCTLIIQKPKRVEYKNITNFDVALDMLLDHVKKYKFRSDSGNEE